MSAISLANTKVAMWTCQACMRGRLPALVGDAAALSPLSRFRQLSTTPCSRRAFQRSTGVSYNDEYGKSKVAPVGATSAPQTKWKAERQEWLESRGVRPPNKLAKKDVDVDFVVRKQLWYLQDPLKLAQHIRKSLRDDDIEIAQALVQGASKYMQCTVSWNHLIEWYLNKGKIKYAFRIYNEMKKRSQTPDARTYTIMFNGAASLPSAPANLGKIVSIYQSMLSDRSPVRPNTIHVNAILKLCARANNMEAMFAILDDLPPKGLRAPNNLTYTTVLNAIRRQAIVDLRKDLTPTQKKENKERVMLEARHVWRDVRKRWLQGDLWIDEEMVCAIGRTFLLGEERDHDDIMSLIEQAMNIPRQAPRLPIPSQKKLLARKSQDRFATSDGNIAKSTSEQGEAEATAIETGVAADGVHDREVAAPEREAGAHESDLDAAFLDQFHSALPTVSSRVPTGAYAKPGSNTLSLLLKSTLYLRLKEPSTKYWELLTKEYGVLPDPDNYACYLRVLRVARASSEAVDLLLQMPQSYLETKAFRIAMSTCNRDKHNPNVFANSEKILDIMRDTQEVQDLPVLTAYIEVALNVRPQDKSARGQQIMRALERIEPYFDNISSRLVKDDLSDLNNETEELFFDEALALIRTMISAHDVLMHKNVVPKSLEPHLARERSKLTALVMKYRKIKMRTPPINTVRKRWDEKQAENYEPNLRFFS